MIRAVDNKKLYLNSFEHKYCLELVDEFGKDCFKDLFKTNDDGRIISITPSVSNPTPLAIIFFLLNVMVNQRLEAIDGLVDRVSKIEEMLDGGDVKNGTF